MCACSCSKFSGFDPPSCHPVNATYQSRCRNVTECKFKHKKCIIGVYYIFHRYYSSQFTCETTNLFLPQILVAVLPFLHFSCFLETNRQSDRWSVLLQLSHPQELFFIEQQLIHLEAIIRFVLQVSQRLCDTVTVIPPLPPPGLLQVIIQLLEDV